jgi:hypothetical protein
VFLQTKDGQELFYTLFGKNKKNNKEMDLEIQIELLFEEMDTNQDHQVEWKEYIAFLLKKQQENILSSCSSSSCSSSCSFENETIITTTTTTTASKDVHFLSTSKQAAVDKAFDKSTKFSSNSNSINFHQRSTKLAKSFALSSSTFVPIPPPPNGSSLSFANTSISKNHHNYLLTGLPLPQLTRTTKADYQIQSSQIETLLNEKKYMQQLYEAEIQSFQTTIQTIEKELHHTKVRNLLQYILFPIYI